MNYLTTKGALLHHHHRGVSRAQRLLQRRLLVASTATSPSSPPSPALPHHDPQLRRPNKRSSYHQRWLNHRQQWDSGYIPVYATATDNKQQQSSSSAFFFVSGFLFRFSSSSACRGRQEESTVAMSRDPASEQLNEYKKSVKVSRERKRVKIPT